MLPAITPLPTPPARTQAPAAFVENADAFVAALPDFGAELNEWAAALADLVFTATSATSVTIGTGAKSFTASTGAVFIPGHFVLIVSDANRANYMRGIVTSYDAETGALVVDVLAVGGAGTFADWTIAVTPSDGAPIDSPIFTGTPAAPTPAAGTNTTQLATTAYVRGEIASLVGTVPSTLDTLDEIAAALGDDANFATTMTTSLGNRLRVDTAAQGLTTTQKSNARTNLSLGGMAIQEAGAVAITGGSAVGLTRLKMVSGTATTALDFATKQVFRIALTANITITFANAPSADESMVAAIHLTGTLSGKTITWPAGISWDGGTAPTLQGTKMTILLWWTGAQWVGSVGPTS